MGARQRCERGVASPQALRCATQPRAPFPNISANHKTVVCDLTQGRTHGRRVGWCYLDGQDIAEALVEAALARDCPRYSGGRYAAVEPAAARESPFSGVLSASVVAGSR